MINIHLKFRYNHLDEDIAMTTKNSGLSIVGLKLNCIAAYALHCIVYNYIRIFTCPIAGEFI